MTSWLSRPSYSTGISGNSLRGLIGPQDDMRAADVKPANDRFFVGTGRDELPLKGVRDRSSSGRSPRSSRRAGSDASTRRSVAPPIVSPGFRASAGTPVRVLEFARRPEPGRQSRREGKARSPRTPMPHGWEDFRARRLRSRLLIAQVLQVLAESTQQGSTPRARRLSFGRSESRPFPIQQPRRICAGLVDETEQDLRRNSNAGFVVVPGPRGQIETAGQLRSTMLAKELLANFSQTARQRSLDIDSDFGRLLASHGARSRAREPPNKARLA